MVAKTATASKAEAGDGQPPLRGPCGAGGRPTGRAEGPARGQKPARRSSPAAFGRGLPLGGDSERCSLQKRVRFATGTLGDTLEGRRGSRQSSPAAPRGAPTRTASCPPGPNGADRTAQPTCGTGELWAFAPPEPQRGLAAEPARAQEREGPVLSLGIHVRMPKWSQASSGRASSSRREGKRRGKGMMGLR
ncbi:unnamed protein product [Prorocentrum cordatum]|uniref:Uncharacterized protein n=1 Tax=Prorocentrum cordatum TaxID=2364126 RepID=A0ABN9RVT7_9DINO|nr:unnamed protein product [Polarella glacialis]